MEDGDAEQTSTRKRGASLSDGEIEGDGEASPASKRARVTQTADLHHGLFCDLKLKLNTEDVNVLKYIFYHHSQWVRDIMGFNKNTADLVTAIDLREYDPQAIKAMLRHMYGHHYACATLGTWSFPSHVQVYLTADKFGVPSLKETAAAEIAAYAQSVGLNQPNIVPELIDALQKLYQTPATTARVDCPVRSVLAKFCAGHLRSLSQDQVLLELMHTTSLGADIALANFGTSRSVIVNYCKCEFMMGHNGKIQCNRCKSWNTDKEGLRRDRLFKLGGT